MTAHEFLRLPPEPDGQVRELIRGTVWERSRVTGTPRQSRTQPRIGHALLNWVDRHPEVGGIVASGNVRCHLTSDPDTIVGIDVVYFAANADAVVDETDSFVGPPTIAVVILSPSDTQEQIASTMRLYLEAGVRHVWLVDTLGQRITVHKPSQLESIFNTEQRITAAPDLPGFTANVADFFQMSHRSSR